MPNFISVQQSKENDPNTWYYAQESDSLATIKSNMTYNAISSFSKASWSGKRLNGTEKNITNNATGGSLAVVVYQKL
ncbi:hypothetical protein [Mucilaginibacter sp.]|uniref:hypothetical protein n=1 Tax=Mucilaginibacter sp. TaxID=1882438 RepID=UPI003D1247EC